MYERCEHYKKRICFYISNDTPGFCKNHFKLQWVKMTSFTHRLHRFISVSVCKFIAIRWVTSHSVCNNYRKNWRRMYKTQCSYSKEKHFILNRKYHENVTNFFTTNSLLIGRDRSINKICHTIKTLLFVIYIRRRIVEFKINTTHSFSLSLSLSFTILSLTLPLIDKNKSSLIIKIIFINIKNKQT